MNLFARFLSACDENHGQVYRRYLLYLIAHRAELKQSALRYQRVFCKNAAANSDLARKFGLIYAGGRFGIEAKVLPWRKDDLLAAILKCYEGARSIVFDDEQLQAQGRAALLAYLKKLPTFSSLDDNEFAESQGYVKPEGNVFRCMLRSEAFVALFKNRQQQRLVMAQLLRNEEIITATPKSHQAPRPQDQFTWPDGKRVRSYEILWGRIPPKK
jgi:hypothetical protein